MLSSPSLDSAPATTAAAAADAVVARRRTRALVVCRQLGAPSEVWIDRQLAGFRQIQPDVVCWERVRVPADAPETVPVHLLPFPVQPTIGPGRWLFRLRNVRHRNFYGTVGRERHTLQRLIRQTGAKVILGHFGHVALRVLPAAAACGVPVVAHFHGLDVSSALRNHWYRSSLRRSLPRLAGVVVVGSHQRRWMLDQGVPPARVHLIPCGVPTDFFVPSDSRPAAGRVRLLAVARLVPWKGLEESLRAVALLRARGVGLSFDIVGDGPQRAELESLTAQLGLSDCVRFHGARSPADIRGHLERSDIFVQHSLTDAGGACEGFGVSLAEAAAMQLPVVATRCGGIPDQVLDGETGLLVPERDVDATADAIARLARDPAWRAWLGAAGRRRMIERFDSTRQIAALERVLLDAARG